MKKKNGFTLIELLAVIVILAIIALIAVPQILNILNKARLNAAKDSTYGIVKAAETYATNFMLENNGSLPSEAIEFECSSSGCNLKTTLTGYNLTGLNNLDFKGTKPTSGKVIISNNGRTIVAENLKINGFNCNYTNDTATCTSDGGSATPEPITPVVTGPTSENPPSGVEGYTGVLKIVYLDPTDLTNSCDASNINSDTETKTGCMKWYAYADDATTYTMILDHNTTATVAWNSDNDNSSMKEVAEQLTNDIVGWNSSLSPRLITADEVAQITGNTSWNSATATSAFTDHIALASSYGWLFDRTNYCIGCLNNAIGTYTSGYWTSSTYFGDSIEVWHVDSSGVLHVNFVSDATRYGVRPVITVSKSKISEM